jgi:hypothetical protein
MALLYQVLPSGVENQSNPSHLDPLHILEVFVHISPTFDLSLYSKHLFLHMVSSENPHLHQEARLQLKLVCNEKQLLEGFH